MDDIEARMWTISENLHRAELTEVQRSQQIAEFVQLAEEKRAAGITVQVGQKLPGRPEGGISAASRDLNMTRHEVRRAQTIAALPETTLAAAEDLGLDDNQSALLAAARAEDPDEQVEVLKDIAARGKVALGARPGRKASAQSRKPLGGRVLPLDQADHAQ